MDLIILLPVLLFSVVIHEVAHAQVALWEGDDTAARLGRITLNPIPHLDPVGSVLVPLLMFFLLPGGFIFGWAKPVPVNPHNFRDYRRGDIRVSLAGVTANFMLATVCALLLGPVLLLTEGGAAGIGGFLYEVLTVGILINLILAVFNLIPIPPLDGSHVVSHLLPSRAAAKYREVGRYGIGLLMLLLFLWPSGLRLPGGAPLPSPVELILWPVNFLFGLVRIYLELWS
jgi:Zn-dependent protease